MFDPGVPLLPFEPALLRRFSSIPNADANVRLRIFFTCACPPLALGDPMGVLMLPADARLSDRMRLVILDSDNVLDDDPFRTRSDAMIGSTVSETSPPSSCPHSTVWSWTLRLASSPRSTTKDVCIMTCESAVLKSHSDSSEWMMTVPLSPLADLCALGSSCAAELSIEA